MKITVTSIDNEKWEFDTDEQFIAFTQGIWSENEAETEWEDVPEYPETFEGCEHYINEHCESLLLQIAEGQ